MLTQGEDVEVYALRKRGWSYVAIGRHIGCDWRTVKAYLEGREPGVRRRSEPDPLERFVPYLKARFADDPHVWASALFDEVVEVGYALSYPSFARQLRAAGLRPHCEACHGVVTRDTIEIAHPPGEEIQWDWFERRRAPWGGIAYVLLGTLPHSGRTRGVIAPSMDQPHLVEAMDGVLRRLGGTARRWRVDRMATVIVPGSADVQASFAPVAKHYGATIVPCPPRRGNRKGSVEAAVRYATGRWWRTLAADSPEAAQVSLDRFWSTTGDARLRSPSRITDPPADGSRPGWPSVGELAEAEPLGALPAFAVPGHDRGGRAGRSPSQRRFPGEPLLGATRPGRGDDDVAPTPGDRHARCSQPCRGAGGHPRPGPGRLGGSWCAPRRTVTPSRPWCWGQFSSARPCERKENRPPGAAALAQRAKLMGAESAEPSVDLAGMAEVIRLAFPGSVEVSDEGASA